MSFLFQGEGVKETAGRDPQTPGKDNIFKHLL